MTASNIQEIPRTPEVAIEEAESLISHPLLSGAEIVNIREGGLIDCWIPVGLIDHEEVPVKEEWVTSLASDMREIAKNEGGTGQLTPIVLGLIDDEPKLRIIDGFHRDAALVANGETRIYATVRKTDWDGLFDKRIFTAKDHAHVRFSRVVQWIREVWEFSGLSDKISVEQAVLLYRFDSNGAKLGLTEEEVTEAKNWVAKKERQWHMSCMTIHSHLKVAENVDPKLVHSTREKKRGDILTAPTQAILKIFSEYLPSQFEYQNLVMETAMQRNLKGPEVKALCIAIGDIEDSDQVREYIEAINWDTWEPAYGETKKRSLRRAHDARYKGAVVLHGAGNDVERVLERLMLVSERDEEVTGIMVENLVQTRAAAVELAGQLGLLQITIDEVIENNMENDEVEPIEVIVDIGRENRDKHKSWGLEFHEYEDDTPGLIIDGKQHFDLNDVSAGIAYCMASGALGDFYNSDRLSDLLEEIGFKPEDITDKKIRTAVQELTSFLKSKGKDNHCITRDSGMRQILVTLV